MSRKKTNLYSIGFVLLLGLSGSSLGFLLGRSHQLQQDPTEQAEAVSTAVQQNGAFVIRVVHGVRNILIK